MSIEGDEIIIEVPKCLHFFSVLHHYERQIKGEFRNRVKGKSRYKQGLIGNYDSSKTCRRFDDNEQFSVIANKKRVGLVLVSQ